MSRNKKAPATPAIRNENINETVSLVQCFWPGKPGFISAELMKKPTKEFVLNFYNYCVTHLNERIEAITKTKIQPHQKGLIAEETLFVKLSQIQSLMNADFKLGDLYKFDTFRVCKHMHVTIHFLTFVETITHETTELYDSVFKIEQEQKQDKEDLHQLREEIYRNKEKLAQCNEEIYKLELESNELLPHYEEAVKATEISENKLKNKILEIEKIKVEIQIATNEIKKLTIANNDLEDEVVPEVEYLELQNELEGLTKDIENLEEIDSNNILLEQRQSNDHLDTCIEALKQLTLNKNISDLLDCRTKIEKGEKSLQHEINISKTNHKDTERVLKEMELKRSKLETEKKKLEKQLADYSKTSDFMQMKFEEKNELNLNNETIILEAERNFEEIVNDKKHVQTEFEKKYNRMDEIQTYAVDMFEKFIKQIMYK